MRPVVVSLRYGRVLLTNNELTPVVQSKRQSTTQRARAGERDAAARRGRNLRTPSIERGETVAGVVSLIAIFIVCLFGFVR